MTPVLQARGMHVAYGGNVAVRHIDIDVPPRSIVGMVGANGAGKSTLVNAIAGWSRGRPSVSGTVRLLGERVEHLPPHRRAAEGLILVPEGKGIFTELTVMENLSLVQPPNDAGDRHAYTMEEIFTLYPRLAERRQHKGGMLSGGERQMVAIARALRAGPRLLLLDEPSAGLAPRLVLDLLLTLRGLVDRGLSLLLVEQNVRAALDVVDHVHLMERGEVRASGTAAEMRDDPRIVEAYLGALAT